MEYSEVSKLPTSRDGGVDELFLRQEPGIKSQLSMESHVKN